MNREQYLKMRQIGEMDIALFYDYYISKNPEIKLNLESFNHLFGGYFMMNQEGILRHLDKEFGIVSIEYTFESKRKTMESKMIFM